METEIEPARRHVLAADLLAQGQHYAQAGLPAVATALHAQAWALAHPDHSDLASAAAWEAAWIALAAHSWREAEAWLQRTTALPGSAQSASGARSSGSAGSAPPAGADAWATARRVLLQLCADLATPAAQGGMPAPPSVPAQPAPRTTPSAPPQTHRADHLPPLHVCTLGAFRLHRGGAEIRPGTARKALAILRYLLTCDRRTAAKDELMELLWPDQPPARAGHSLHVAVSTLRTTIDPARHPLPARPDPPPPAGQPPASYILFSPDRYQINPDAEVEDDAARFLELCRRAGRLFHAGDHARARDLYQEALALYAGDYAVESGDLLWATAQRERLIVCFLDALDHLGQIHVAQQEWDAAAACYRRLIDRDSFREDAHRALMLCAWKLGRRADALRQFDLCAQVLDRELGLEPMAETHALRRRLLDGLEG